MIPPVCPSAKRLGTEPIRQQHQLKEAHPIESPAGVVGMDATLKARTVSGLRWTILNGIGEKALSFGTTMVLARLLDPVHFGLYALAFVAIDSFGIFKNLGLDAAIVQRKDRIDDAADTAFLALPIVGITLCALLYFSAPTLAMWLGNPGVERPMQVLGTVLILMSIGNVPSALIQKSMRFEYRMIANLSGMVAYAAAAIWLAMHGWGVWSLVFAYLLRWTISIPIQWVLIGWRPRWRFDWLLFKEMFQFSKYVMGAWLIGFLAVNVDKVSIGRWLGATELGYYTLCLGLANIATSQLSARLYLVAFPAFAEAQDKPDMLRRGFLKLVKYLLLFSLPVSLLLALMPSDLLRVFYGEQWTIAAPVLQILAISGATQTIRVGTDPVLLGCGRSRAIFKLNMLQFALLVVGGVGMAMSGSLTGVAWAVLVASGIPCGIGFSLVLRRIGISPAEVLLHVRAVLLSGVAMAGSVMACQWLRTQAGFGNLHPALWVLIVLTASGLTYLGTTLLWDRPLARDVAQLLCLRGAGAAKG